MTLNSIFYFRISQLQIAEGATIPRGFGIAWWRPNVSEAVVLPLGIHWLAGGVRAAYWWAVRSYVPEPIERAYRRGWDEALKMEERRRRALEQDIRRDARKELFDELINSVSRVRQSIDISGGEAHTPSV